MNNIFFCYSKRLACFIMAFNVRYINIGINQKTNMKYYTFEKSERLDQIIELYNKVKYLV